MSGAAKSAFFLVLVILLPAASSSAPPDQGWQRQGYEAEYGGIHVLAAPDPLDPLAWASYHVTLASVADDEVVLDVHAWRPGTDHHQSVSYDRASRVGSTGGAYLWVGEAEIAQGHALLGERTAHLVLSTDEFHQFSDGSASYYYSAQTGLLLRADSTARASLVLRTG